MNAFESVSGVTRPRLSLMKLFCTTRVRTANRGIGIITMRQPAISIWPSVAYFFAFREGAFTNKVAIQAREFVPRI